MSKLLPTYEVSERETDRLSHGLRSKQTDRLRGFQAKSVIYLGLLYFLVVGSSFICLSLIAENFTFRHPLWAAFIGSATALIIPVAIILEPAIVELTKAIRKQHRKDRIAWEALTGELYTLGQELFHRGQPVVLRIDVSKGGQNQNCWNLNSCGIDLSMRKRLRKFAVIPLAETILAKARFKPPVVVVGSSEEEVQSIEFAVLGSASPVPDNLVVVVKPLNGSIARCYKSSSRIQLPAKSEVFVAQIDSERKIDFPETQIFDNEANPY